MGRSGEVTGVHLHFETLNCSSSTCNSASYTNPRTYLNDLGGPDPRPLKTELSSLIDLTNLYDGDEWYSYDEIKNMTPEERKAIVTLSLMSTLNKFTDIR